VLGLATSADALRYRRAMPASPAASAAVALRGISLT